ncbi:MULTISPECIES: hypothetical protein [unclassified Sphingomonas]|uniref:hypothetical protein n=1 Tax=unclassified Sphingomonas TaxID=196159 RepID=UPI000AC0FEC1|nr:MULTISPECIES: hypothetical protein [unclassified Sphingomonas]
MGLDSENTVPSIAAEHTPRSRWQTPSIEDADISALTEGTGTSGVEGPAFLKVGS